MDHVPEDPYNVLGVGRNAAQAEIKTHYRKMLLKIHPDKFSDPVEREKRQPEFERVQRAYEILGNENARSDYDLIRDLRKHTPSMKSVNDLQSSSAGYRLTTNGPPLNRVNTAAPEEEEQRTFRRHKKEHQAQVEKEIDERNKRAYRHLAQHTADESLREEQQEDAGTRSINELKPSVAEKETRLFSVPATQLGMRFMNPALVNAAVDIVAVHGLGAIPDITWRDRKSGVNWLSDPQMLPSLTPKARILRFGYDSLWLGKEAIRTRLPTIADKLLLVLARERQEDPSRPLVFIGHCFGGLVIQRALITAKLYPESETEEAILNSAVGAVFLGTPHRGTGAFGSQGALLAAIAAQSELYPSMEAGVLDAMKSERGELLDVSEDFLKLSARAKIRITCFFEQRESNLGKMIGRNDIRQFVVDETSARLGANRAIGIATDHFRLNKFADPEDGNYLDVAGEVARFYTKALSLAKERRPSSCESSRDLEQYRRLVAKQELKLEEAAKEAALKEEEFERRFQKKLEENEHPQKQESRSGTNHIERLQRNMRRYGLSKRAVHDIFQSHPPPDVEHITEDKLQERDQWYQNSLKGALLDVGLEEGEVDAIVHDTGETMVIEGVRTSITRMSKRWLSERTLLRYGIPYMRDPQQSSTLIIKRWVPLYEEEFLWDHSQELRARPSRRRQEDTLSSQPSGSRDGLRNYRSTESMRSDAARDSILRRRQASAEWIRTPPSRENIVRRRASSRTLQDQNRSRRSSTDSLPRKSRPSGDDNDANADVEDTKTRALGDREGKRWRTNSEVRERKRTERAGELETKTGKAKINYRVGGEKDKEEVGENSRLRDVSLDERIQGEKSEKARFPFQVWFERNAQKLDQSLFDRNT